MPTPLPPDFDLDDVIRRYLAGESSKKLAATTGVSASTIQKRLAKAGVLRTPAESAALRRGKSVASWVDEAVTLHLAGVPQTEIGRRVGRAQPNVSDALIRRGYRTDRGEAERRKWAAMSTEERAAQVAAAHAASRGRVLPLHEMEKRALTKQHRQSHATDEERTVARLMEKRGEKVVLQQAVSKYNLDIGAGPVAVELFGGGWHGHGHHRARLPQRMMDLADAGFNTLLIWTRWDHPLNASEMADQAVSYVQTSRSDPAFRRQYRVVWGDGEFIAAGCVDDDKVTFIPAGIRSTYSHRR